MSQGMPRLGSAWLGRSRQEPGMGPYGQTRNGQFQIGGAWRGGPWLGNAGLGAAGARQGAVWPENGQQFRIGKPRLGVAVPGVVRPGGQGKGPYGRFQPEGMKNATL